MGIVLVAGLFSLGGTVLGGALTIFAARQAAHRSERSARTEGTRQEYRSALVKFAAATLAYRESEIDRWHARRGGYKDEKQATEEVYRTRRNAWQAFYELDFATDDETVVALARCALDRAYGMRQVASRPELNLAAEEVRADIERLIAHARNVEAGIPREIRPGQD
jgi:hypothetical protein